MAASRMETSSDVVIATESHEAEMAEDDGLFGLVNFSKSVERETV